MKEQILKALHHIEETQEVKVLFAAEAGSRAWGFASPDSDWDVRYVYVRNRDWYMTMDNGRDVLDDYHKMMEGTEFNDQLLDITGWDLNKTMRMLRKSNPQLLEWINSPSIYIDLYGKDLEELATKTLRLFPVQEHYRAMAKTNFREYLQGAQVRYKKYLYVIRPLMAAQWVRSRNSFPPVDFNELCDAIVPQYENSTELRHAIQCLLAVKNKSSEVAEAPRDPVLHSWIEREVFRTDGIQTDEYERSTEVLNNFLINTINDWDAYLR